VEGAAEERAEAKGGGRRGGARWAESDALSVRFAGPCSSHPPSLRTVEEEGTTTLLAHASHKLVLVFSLVGKVRRESGHMGRNVGVGGGEGGGGQGGREGGKKGLEVGGEGGKAESAVEEVGILLVLGRVEQRGGREGGGAGFLP